MIFELLLLIAVPVLFWEIRKLSRRVSHLEDRIVQAERSRVAVPGAVASGVAEAPATVDPPPLPQAPAPAEAPTGPDEREVAAAAATPPPGPWEAATVRPMLPPLPPARPAPPLLGQRFATFGRWLVANWVYAVAAVSLVLAGVFLVQYGMERGLLPPAARVLAALGLGAALIGGGEAIRRRWGDSADRSTAYLPSTFSGAGIVALFIGVFAARQLYGLIGAEAAFAGFLAVAAVALLLGWFHGPFLAAIGLIGAGATPFMVGGGSAAPDWLPFYHALIAAVGLGIDTLRRWAWVSVLALVIGFGGLLMLSAAGADQVALALAATLVPLLAMAIPARSAWPDQQGATLANGLWRGGQPAFPTLLAAGAGLVAVTLILLWPAAGMAGFACLAVLVVAIALWAWRAPALSDLAALPALAFVLRLIAETQGWPLWQQVRGQAIALRAPETPAPPTLAVLAGLALAGSMAAALRSLRGTDHPRGWAALAALFAPVTLLVLELFWQPAAILGAGLWAGLAIGLATVMVFVAERFARADGGPGPRTAYAVLAVLSLIALALFVLLTQAALTLALAVLLVTAAALDRRLCLPEMGWFIQAGIAVIGWRMVVDPGLAWTIDAPLWEAVLSLGGVVLGAAAARGLIDGLPRPGPKLGLETTGITAAVLLADVLIWRWIDSMGGVPQHAAATLMALPWILAMFAQLHRRAADQGWLRLVRLLLALVAGVAGIVPVLVAATLLNPAIDFLLSGRVRGAVVLSSMALAYAVPGALLVFGARRIAMPRRLRLPLVSLGGALLALWVALEIRHFWHGPQMTGPTIQAELYSYTVALLLTGAALLYLAIARRSAMLRRVAMGVIGLTVAKVFLIDASGLAGLMRVASFLGLGLALAGLAWLNRWTAERGAGSPGPERPQA